MSNKKLNTINIKGKDYVLVSERLKYFRENEKYAGYSLVTELIDFTPERVCMIAKVIDENGVVRATGHAFEEKQASYINKTSYLENCETSACGRALAILGIGIDENVASADEVSHAIELQEGATKSKSDTPKANTAKTDPIRDEALNNPQAITPTQIANLEGVFKLQPDGGKTLRALVLDGKEIKDLTQAEYGIVQNKIGKIVHEREEAEKKKHTKENATNKYINSYANVKKITPQEAVAEIEKALGVNIRSMVDDVNCDCEKLWSDIQGLAQQ